jgi:hypothetical protein
MLTFVEKYIWAIVVAIGYGMIFYEILTVPLWR